MLPLYHYPLRSLRSLKFVSDCENGTKITKKYLVLGIGLGVGLQASFFGNSNGHFGGTSFNGTPSPISGISVSGPSAGIGYGGTIGSATLDFTSFADVSVLSDGVILGGSLFDFEGQYYIPLGGPTTEKCCN